MLRLAQFAPAMIGLTLALPATAQAQSHPHSQSHGNCEVCNAAQQGTPVVKERRGPLGRVIGGKRVSIPAGHAVAQQKPQDTSPPAAWSETTHGSPYHTPEVAYDDASDPETGFASVGGSPGDSAPPIPSYGTIAAGEPMPIGEMRTSYVSPTPHAAPMAPTTLATTPNPAAMNSGFTGVPVIPRDPRIEMFHQQGLAGKMGSRRSGPLETMLGVSGMSNWLEQRRTIRAMRASAKSGAYAPSMHEMPGWAVGPR